MPEANDKPKKMNLLDDRKETESGMYLSALADEPGEAEAAMYLNSLVDDPEALTEEAEEFIDAVDHRDDAARITKR